MDFQLPADDDPRRLAVRERLAAHPSPTGAQLAEAGYVRLGKPGARASQPYAITPAGKRAFNRWIAESPGREALRNPVALRVAFGALQSADQLRETYTQAIEQHSAALSQVREQAKEARKEGDEFAAASLDFAVAYHRASVTWLKNVLGK